MIIKNFELKKLENTNINLILLYGENEGFKHEIINNFFTKNFDGEIKKYEEEEVFLNYNEFVSNLLNKSFFNDKKLLILSRTSEKILRLIDELIIKDLKDIKIIINSKSLDKKSKLRSFFEKEKKCACIPFYDDDERTLGQIASNFFFSVALGLLASNFSGSVVCAAIFSSFDCSLTFDLSLSILPLASTSLSTSSIIAFGAESPYLNPDLIILTYPPFLLEYLFASTSKTLLTRD